MLNTVYWYFSVKFPGILTKFQETVWKGNGESFYSPFLLRKGPSNICKYSNLQTCYIQIEGILVLSRQKYVKHLLKKKRKTKFKSRLVVCDLMGRTIKCILLFWSFQKFQFCFEFDICIFVYLYIYLTYIHYPFRRITETILLWVPKI